ncbi:DUF1573 domain-containing protein [Flavobacterium sp.]|uniref:DUF1573 domain-containing protein n=1 Tax=Flavobacterium sp. TaxID=239 RepID=UPI0026079B76|nr:DUF1573 domain-containing protein [Flavobacterium sp.]MDD3004205.1 DUF1573 domain-containing protein [Flavobacterium sp.]
MKKSILLFSALALFAFSNSNAQEAPKKAAKAKITKTIAPKVQGAGITFESETIDYGTIEHKADGNRQFVLTNDGTEPLVIVNAQGSCGCTVPTVPKEPIAPGANGVIGVKYDTNRPGPFTKTITVTSNSKTSPTKVLTIKGNVKPAPATAAPAVKS